MDRARFLRTEYDRIMECGTFVWSGWRDSFERFRADLWDMTPAWSARRYLVPRDPELGYAPDNVEWHFQGRNVKRPKTAAGPSKAKGHPRIRLPKQIAPKITPQERKAAEAAAREARRQKLAEEFRRWERLKGRG